MRKRQGSLPLSKCPGKQRLHAIMEDDVNNSLVHRLHVELTAQKLLLDSNVAFETGRAGRVQMIKRDYPVSSLSLSDLCSPVTTQVNLFLFVYTSASKMMSFETKRETDELRTPRVHMHLCKYKLIFDPNTHCKSSTVS